MKKKNQVFTKNGTLYFPKFKRRPALIDTHQIQIIGGDADEYQTQIIGGYADEDHTQIIGGDADEDHTQSIGRDTVKLFGGYILPIPRVSAPLVVTHPKSL